MPSDTFPKISGMLIGSPWTDPAHQYPSFIPYAKMHNLLSGDFLALAETKWADCAKTLKAMAPDTVPSRVDTCEGLQKIVMQQSMADGRPCMNVFDIRLRDRSQTEGCGMSWPWGILQTAQYLSVHPT